jgi:hypothetical protein
MLEEEFLLLYIIFQPEDVNMVNKVNPADALVVAHSYGMEIGLFHSVESQELPQTRADPCCSMFFRRLWLAGGPLRVLSPTIVPCRCQSSALVSRCDARGRVAFRSLVSPER